MALNNKNYSTKSGIIPDEITGVPYSITTGDVQNYLQHKINCVLKAVANKNGTETENIEVNVYSTESGSKFVPFMVSLPMNALKDNSKQHKRKGAAIFNVKSEDGTAQLKDELFNLLKNYAYNDRDYNAFGSTDWQNMRGVGRESAYRLQNFLIPRITNMNGNRDQTVLLLVDPLRVFHDMLQIEGDRSEFYVEIVSWKKQETGKFRYNVRRCKGNPHNNKKKKKMEGDIINQIMTNRRR